MKFLIIFSLLLVSKIGISQSVLDDEKSEQLVNFTSVLIDYEIYNGKLVALTRDHGEYFIYYVDSSGTGLFQAFDIFFPTKLTVDDRGYLFIAGLDSAFQLSISNHIETIKATSIDEYLNVMSASPVYFDSTKASIINDVVLFHKYNNESDSMGHLIRMYQFKEEQSISMEYRPRIASTNNRSQLDQTLMDDRKINIENDIIKDYRNTRRNQLELSSRNSINQTNNYLNGFRSNGTLWLIDEIEYKLVVLNENGDYLHSNRISPYPPKCKFLQDASNGKVYILTKSNGKTLLHQLDETGQMTFVCAIKKGISKSDLKISDGHLYYRDSKGTGVSVKRIKLD